MHSSTTGVAGRRFSLLCLSVWLCAVFGCSAGSDKWVKGRPPVYKASGKVMYQGKPLEGALVLYHPVSGETSAYGRTDPNGKFLLTTFEQDDGAPEGPYKVVVTKMEYEVKPTAYDSPDEKAVARIPKPLLPAKYSKKETTDLTAEVVADGDNEAVFEIAE